MEAPILATRFPLACSSWDSAEHEAMQRVIASNFFTMGREVAAFEREFATFTGSKYAVMVNSGSSANLLMTAASFFCSNPANRLQRGDEVIVPAIGWSTTYFPLSQYGLHLKFVDIDLNTLNYDAGALRAAVGDKTRAIMVVNLLGNPNDFAEVEDIISGRDILMIEDNCESMGATLGGRQAGTFGAMGSFSSFFSHHISTMEGGLVVTDDEELFHILLSLRSHGWTRNLPAKNLVTGTKSDNDFDESWRFVLPGYNLRPTELSGALGLEQLKKLPKLLEGRRANGSLLQSQLLDHPDLIIQTEIGSSSWFGFSLVIRRESQLTRPELISRLTAKGFEIRPIVSGNFVKNDVMRYIDYSISGELKNADHVDQNGVFVGNQHFPMPEAIDALASL